MADYITLVEHMTSLFKAGVLDVNFFSYFKLRQRSTTSPVVFDYNIYTGTNQSVDIFAVAAALWQKGLVTLNPFPNVTVRFSNEVEALSEAEVLRSQDTVSPSIHIFNSIKAESNRIDSNTVVINEAFRTRWHVTTDNLLRYLPSLLKKADTADRLDTYYSANPSIVWTSAATLNPASVSAADLKALFALGLDPEAYLFWILNSFLELRSPVQTNLTDINTDWGIDNNTALAALGNLQTGKIISAYEADQITLIWLKTLSTLGTAEIDYAGALMTAEGKMMYQLWKDVNPIDPTLFCTLNAITPANFYKNLRRIKAKGIIDISVSTIEATWYPLFNPPDTSGQLRKPVNVTATAIDSSKLRVTWVQPGTNATNWRVMYRVKDSGVAYSEKNPATSPAVITGLLPSTQYEIYVYSEGLGDLKPSDLTYGSTTVASAGGTGGGTNTGGTSTGGTGGGGTTTPTTPTIPTGFDIWLKFAAGELQTNSGGTYGPAATTGDNITSINDTQRGNVVKLGDQSGFVFYNQPQPAAYTRSAWIKVEEYHDWSALFGAESGNEASRHNLMLNSDDPAISLWNNYDWVETDSTQVPLNQWLHVASTFSGGTFKLYVNGVLRVTKDGLTYAPDSTNSTVFIGLMGFGNASWNNFIDDVVWYPRALTQAEITQLYNATTV